MGRQRQDQDWTVGGVHFPVTWIGLQTGRKVRTGRIDGRLDVARGPIDVAIKTELQDDAGLADTALRGHFGHVGDLAEVSLERACDAGCDRLGAGAGQLRLDRNGGEVDLWQRRDRQLGDGEEAGQRDPNSQQRRCDRAGNEWRREIHWSTSSPAK